MSMPGHDPTVAPGMTQVVEAGTSYHIEDESGQGLTIDARDHPDVVAFIHEFDNWLVVDGSLPNDARDIRDATWAAVIAKWHKLPAHIQRDLPSTRAGGVVVPVHSH